MRPCFENVRRSVSRLSQLAVLLIPIKCTVFSDADGHELPRNVFSCQSCETLFNVTITVSIFFCQKMSINPFFFFQLLKNPIDKLNKAAADILCVGAPESCRSEFLDIVEIVGAVGKMFRGKVYPTS